MNICAVHIFVDFKIRKKSAKKNLYSMKENTFTVNNSFQGVIFNLDKP